MGQSFYLSIGALLVLQVGIVIVGMKIRKKRLRGLAEQYVTPSTPSVWRAVAFGAVMWIVLTVVTLATASGSVLIAMLGAFPMSLMFVAIGFFARVKQRQGKTPRCSACEYDLTGTQAAEPSEQIPDGTKCPECGALCSKPGIIVYGERVVSRPVLFIACLLLVPLFVKLTAPMIFGFSSTGAFFVSLMPTGALIKQAAYYRSFRMSEWAELRKRTFTPDQRETLAKGLLTRDALQLHAWGDEAKWLVVEFAAGRLSPEIQRMILQRYVHIGFFPIDTVGTMSIRPTAEQAWGMQGCFAGWTIFAVRGPVLDTSSREMAPPSPIEIEIDQSELGSPAAAISVVNPLRASLDNVLGTVPPDGRLAVWIIAEPRVRTAQPVVWKDGVPVTASDAIVVRFDLKPPAK